MLETGGGDTSVVVKAAFSSSPPTTDGQYYEFVPECGGFGGRAQYGGPYYLMVSYDQLVPITCIYRTITIGHPVACYDGIADSTDVTQYLTKLDDFTLSAMSLPSKSSSFPYYQMDYHGTYSVLGVGVWTDKASSSSGNGTFEGTMYLNYGSTMDKDVVIVEGYAGMNSTASSPQGSFSLRTWELTFKSDETVRKSAPLQELTKQYTWSCFTTDDEYHFDVVRCNSSTRWDVHWLGLWSQYSNILEADPNALCYPVSPMNFYNRLMMVPNGHDTLIFATVSYNYAGSPSIDFTMYGKGCGNGPCNGPSMLLGCEHAVNHGLNTPWVDIGVGNQYKTVWLSDKMGYMGAKPYDGSRSISSTITKWVAGTNVQQSNIKFKRYFNTHSRSLDTVYWSNGKYPDSTEKDVVFEGMSSSYIAVRQSTLDKTIPPAGVESKLADNPYPIVCYLTVETDCVLSVKPWCSIALDTDLNMGSVEVSFPAEAFVNMGGLDDLGWAKVRGQLQGFKPDGELLGTPIDVTGLIIPFSDPTPDDGITGPVVTGPMIWSCQNCRELLILITDVAIPVFTSMILNMHSALGDRTEGTILGFEYGVLSMTTLYIWSRNHHVQAAYTEAKRILRLIGAYCCCNFCPCFVGDGGGAAPTGVPDALLDDAAQAGADNAHYNSMQHSYIGLEQCHSKRSHGNGDASDEDVTCSPTLLDGTSSNILDPGIAYIDCSNDAKIWFRPSIGMERAIQKIILEATAPSASIYGYGTAVNSTDQVGILCTFDITIVPFSEIQINSACRLSVNGYPPTENTIYTINAPGITTVTFPEKQSLNNVH